MKKISFIVMVSLCVVLMIGCSNKKKTSIGGETNASPSPIVNETETPDATNEPDLDPSNIPTTENPVATQEPVQEEMIDLNIYTINDESLEPEETTVQVAKTDNITAQIVADAVTKTLLEAGVEIKINSIDVKDGIATVDFNSEYAPLRNVGSGVEGSILDCIAMSLLDNADDCNKIIFRADGNAYESGHIILDYNEVYKWK